MIGTAFVRVCVATRASRKAARRPMVRSGVVGGVNPTPGSGFDRRVAPHVQVVPGHRLAAGLARMHELEIGAAAVNPLIPVLRRPPLAPLLKRQEHRPELLARGRQVVLEADGPLLVLPLRDDTRLLETPKAAREDVARRARVPLDLVEA